MINCNLFVAILSVISFFLAAQKISAKEEFIESVAPTIYHDTFSEYAGYLNSAGIINMSSSNTQVNKTDLDSICKSYRMKFVEFLETIARQTSSSVKYDEKTKRWLFEPPAMPLSYQVKMADGWRERKSGMYTAYIPTVQPVGMDVYMLGRFKNLSEAQLIEIRNEQAIRFAERMKNGTTFSDFKNTKVDGVEAIYFECPAPTEKRYWRQWSFIKNNQSFMIVSTYDEKNTEKIRADVDSMVASFHVVEPAVPFPGF